MEFWLHGAITRQKGSYRQVGVNLVVVLQGALRSQAHQSRTTIHSQDDIKLEAGIFIKGERAKRKALWHHRNLEQG